MTTALGEHDLLMAIEVPAKQNGQGAAYVKFTHPASRYAVIGVAAAVTVSGGKCTAAAVAVGGLVPRPMRAPTRREGARRSGAVRRDHRERVAPGRSGSRRRHPRRPLCVRRVPEGRRSGLGQESADRGRRPREVKDRPDLPPASVASIEQLEALLARQLYIADRGLATSIYLALTLQRPLLLEGEAGVGKTEVAKVLASGLDTSLIRLQCYEGLDVSQAVYEWNYARQLLEIRLMEASGAVDRHEAARELFGEEFLIKRPLLQALSNGGERPPVLLIDELDRADEEFEGFLLELLADFQITIPELGTIRAAMPPIVIITSNRTRELHDALKRRCLYFWIDYPDFEKELRIVTTKVPGAPARLAEQVTAFVQELRTADLYKAAGVSETLDWVAALVALDRTELDPATIDQTLGLLLKNQEDIQAVRGERVSELLNRARAGR